MADPVRITKTLTTASANNIALSQTPGAAGNLTLNGALVSGGVATMDTARRVLFTFAGADAGRTFVVYGTNAAGNYQQESVAGANSPTTSTTLLDFKTVTRISVDAATAGALTVGTSGVGATQWVNSNYHNVPVNWSIAVVVTGTVNYTVQYTYDDFWTAYPNNNSTATTIPTPWDDPILAAVTTTGDTTFSFPITGWRVQINSGTGSLAITGIQAGIRGN